MATQVTTVPSRVHYAWKNNTNDTWAKTRVVWKNYSYNSFLCNTKETATVVDRINISLVLQNNEMLLFVDTPSRLLERSFYECATNILDHTLRAFTGQKNESGGLSDCITRLSFVTRRNDSINTDEKVGKSIEPDVRLEKVYVSKLRIPIQWKGFNQTWDGYRVPWRDSVNEMPAKEFDRIFIGYRNPSEEISSEDGYDKIFLKALRDYMTTHDDETFRITKSTKDALRVAENLERAVRFYRLKRDSVLVSDNLRRWYRFNRRENITSDDIFYENSKAVLSDVYLGEEAITESEFMKLVNTPAGFNQFIKYKVGEYEYKEALVRLSVSNASEQSQPTLSGIVVHVDIEDTDDRGIAEIISTASATNIRFNKHYYNPPEVVATIRGGNTANGLIYPSIIKITTTGFDVELVGQDGRRATGVISWTSKGY